MRPFILRSAFINIMLILLAASTINFAFSQEVTNAPTISSMPAILPSLKPRIEGGRKLKKGGKGSKAENRTSKSSKSGKESEEGKVKGGKGNRSARGNKGSKGKGPVQGTSDATISPSSTSAPSSITSPPATIVTTLITDPIQDSGPDPTSIGYRTNDEITEPEGGDGAGNNSARGKKGSKGSKGKGSVQGTSDATVSQSLTSAASSTTSPPAQIVTTLIIDPIQDSGPDPTSFGDGSYEGITETDGGDPAGKYRTANDQTLSSANAQTISSANVAPITVRVAMILAGSALFLI